MLSLMCMGDTSAGGPPCRHPCDTRAEGIMMTTTSLASSVHPLLPYEVQPGRLLLASGVRAGGWSFASGLLPTRFGATAGPDWAGRPPAVHVASSRPAQAAHRLARTGHDRAARYDGVPTS